MKILVPLNNKNYLKDYVEAGADEFYLGFYDESWLQELGKYTDLNRMSGFHKKANKYNFDEMIEVVEAIKYCGKSAFITMNANAYSKRALDYIQKNYLSKILKSKVDGVIASDPNLVKLLVSCNIPSIASTMCGVYNSDIAKYYYKLGVKRVILPRDLSLDEISMICSRFPDIKYEVFFMRNGCAFSDGYCLGMHGDCGSTCEFIRNHPKRIITSYREFNDIHSFDVNEYLYNSVFHRYACGMCALYRMKSIGIGSLKIVGRADMYQGICEDIKLTKENLYIVEKSQSENEYLKNMRFPIGAHIKCMEGLSCYYPEVRFS